MFPEHQRVRHSGHRIEPAHVGMRLGKAAMIKRIGAKLTNLRWGWDAVMPDGSVVFIGWRHRVAYAPDGQIESCRIFGYGSCNNESPGWPRTSSAR